MEKSWSAIALVYNPLQAGSIDGTDDRPHDRAVERALKARYNPDKTLTSSAECSVFVGRLNTSTTEETLRMLFEKYGDVKSLRLVRDIVTGLSKGYAFIEYSYRGDARRAISEANHTYVDGSEIYVDHELSRTLEGWIPRRLGGGFGGKKESGQLRFGGKDRPFKKPIVVQNKEARENHDNYRRNDRYEDEKRERRRSRDRERERDRDRGRNRDRDRGRDRDINCGRERDKTRNKERDEERRRRRNRDRDRSRSRDRDRDHDRDREKDKKHDRDRNRDTDKESSPAHDIASKDEKSNN